MDGGRTKSGHAQRDFGRKSARPNNWEARGIKGSAREKVVRECGSRHKQGRGGKQTYLVDDLADVTTA